MGKSVEDYLLYIQLIRLSKESGDTLCDKSMVLLTMQNIESAMPLKTLHEDCEAEVDTVVLES